MIPDFAMLLYCIALTWFGATLLASKPEPRRSPVRATKTAIKPPPNKAVHVGKIHVWHQS